MNEQHEGGNSAFACSSQQLVDVSNIGALPEMRLDGGEDVDNLILRVSSSQWFTVAVLCFVNLINYMDRFTIAGVLSDIQDEFDIGDDEGGLLQTAFVVFYMLFAPIFGYLGDRYSRRFLIAFGIFLWSATTFLGSFMQHYQGFICFRALVGVGEASYSTIAPTIISDMFVDSLRTKMLAFFYFAIPVGSGLGYIVGSTTAGVMGNWRWSLRVTPILGVIAVILIFLFEEPVRGESEGSQLQPTSYRQDIKELVRNPSYMLSTAGFTCVAFATGALSWWGTKYLYLGLKLQSGSENISLNDVSFKFGMMAMFAGLIGVPLGAILAEVIRPKVDNCDPYICAYGLLISAPFTYLALILTRNYAHLCYLLVFISQVLINLTWSIIADILLYVVIPTRRSSAEAFQILFSHAFGDAGSPYLVGLFSELMKNHLRETTLSSESKNVGHPTMPDPTWIMFEALQYALFITCFIEVIGGIFFLLTALFVVQDKEKASQSVRGER